MHLQISECFCFGTRQKGFVFSNFPKQKRWKVTDVNEKKHFRNFAKPPKTSNLPF